MGLITLVQPDERFWLHVTVDDTDPTEIKHKLTNDEPDEQDLNSSGWSAIECRRMPADWFEDAKTRYTKWVNDRTGRYEQTNWQGYRKEIVKHIVISWKGMSGNPPCTEENKLKLPQAVQLLVISQSSGLVSAPDKGELQKNS